MLRPKPRNSSTKRGKMQIVCATRKRPTCKTIKRRWAARSRAWPQQEVFGIARKALADLATVSLEERMGEVFTRRVHQIDGKDKELLAAALKTSSEPAVVRSAFPLPTEQQAAIQNALNETFSAVVRIRFETTKDAICGIELSANGQKVGWSIATYISALDQKDRRYSWKPNPAQQAKAAPKPTPAPTPPAKSSTQAAAK